MSTVRVVTKALTTLEDEPRVTDPIANWPPRLSRAPCGD